MNIILLNGVFPFKKKIVLSKRLGIEIDNPKTRDEISLVRDFLKSKVDFQEAEKLEKHFLLSDSKAILHKDYLRKILKRVATSHSKNPLFDKDFINRSKAGNDYDCLIKSWVIVRFEDGNFFKDLAKNAKEEKKKNPGSFVFLSGDELGPQREERAFRYLSIIDLLLNDKLGESLRKTIILDTYKNRLNNWLFVQLTGLIHGRTIHKELDLYTIADNLNKIIDLCSKIESLSEERLEKLLYIGETIRTINEYGIEAKMTFMMLVGILEFLLTHNPDFNRFNVEDSIRKQFQLKVGIMINRKEGESLESLSAILREMYDIRSAIAHGDFMSIKNGSRKGNIDIYKLTNKAYEYVSMVVTQFCYEPNFVESLKKI